MDRVTLRLTPRRGTTEKRRWALALPALIGLLVALGLLLTPAPAKPIAPPIAACPTHAQIMDIPACVRRVHSKARLPQLRQASDGSLRISEEDELRLEFAKHEVYNEILDAQEAHDAAIATWREEVAAASASRWWSVVPLSLGVLLSLGLWLLVRVRAPLQPREIVLSAHHLIIDGLKLPIVEMESYSVSEAANDWRTLVLAREVGPPIVIRLDDLDPYTDRLIAFLENLPDASERAEERRQIASMELAGRAVRDR